MLSWDSVSAGKCRRFRAPVPAPVLRPHIVGFTPSSTARRPHLQEIHFEHSGAVTQARTVAQPVRATTVHETAYLIIVLLD
jgi:hypothetical protein